MAALGKRPLEPLFGNIDKPCDDDTAPPSPKRLCCTSPATPQGIAVGDLWDGMPCDEEDLPPRDRIVEAALKVGASVDDLVAALIEPTTYQVELAMVQLFGQGSALSLLCDAIAGPSASLHRIAVDALLYRAASDSCPCAVGALITRLAEEDDVERALATAVEENDVAATEVIIKAYESDINTPDDSCRRVKCNALCNAIEFGEIAVVDYLAGLCDGETVEELLSQCAADYADPKAAVFAALWRHADLCAHAYGKSLPPCPALNYLRDFIESGEPCADGCMSNVDDDDDSDDDDPDRDTDDDDGQDDRSNGKNDGDGDKSDDEGKSHRLGCPGPL